MDGRDVARLVGIEMKETEREEAKPADEAKPGEAQPGEPRTEVP